MMHIRRSQTLVFAVFVLVILLVLSGLRPFDRTTWMLEVFPVVIALPVLWATYHRFPLTNLLYFFIFLHALVLMLGGAYSYARVPLGFYLADWLDLSRNPYDKIGHFFQGFVPALVAREILVRGRFVRGRKMLAFVVLSIILAISALYELIEWAAALILGQGADEFGHPRRSLGHAIRYVSGIDRRQHRITAFFWPPRPPDRAPDRR